jgi:ATP-dependent DNA ligase
LLDTPFAERRTRLETVMGNAEAPLFVTPLTRDRERAADWFVRFEGAGFDGVMAKQPDGGYQPNKRAMFKVKHKRTVDCVVGGFRWHKRGKGELVGSLLLGLYDGEGKLHHVGVAASFTEKRRAELVAELEPYREGADDNHPWSWEPDEDASPRQPGGGHSRWNANKDLRFNKLRPELVCEVTFDHLQGTRFRHTAHFVRWRPDKPARECTYEQIDVTPPVELSEIFKR